MIIGNGRLITNSDKIGFMDNGAVLIKGNVVEEIGDFETLKKANPNEEVLDANGQLIMPGMICAHSHIYSAYARGMAPSGATDNFFNILENLWWKLDRSLGLEDIKLNAYTTYAESIKSGVTTLIDHHASGHCIPGSLFALEEVAKKIGVRTSLCFETTDRDGKEATKAGIKENVDFIKHTLKDNDDMVKGLFGMHASFTISDETMSLIKEAMEGVDAGYHVHVTEGIEDQYDSLKKYGRKVGERLYDWGILGDKTLAIHCIHLSQGEMDIIKATDTSVVTNPESNMNNAVGAPPVVQMLKKGIRVGLGSDAYTQDMFESMKVSNILQSHHLADPTVGFMETKALQFENNPKICAKYWDKPLGKIEKGAYADIIVVDYKPHTPMSDANWFGHLLFGVNGGMVKHTVINGKLVMKDRIILTVDMDKINADSTQRASEIWKNM
ncbi:putative aminohydrolase SsnA [Peptoanaerobacter stomatis]|uniref:putative aminohydrolase SsnA n=1 Tax=Peptoanaerobacter stomatis TaxID=796937 RepID=UPI003FA17448